MRKKLSFFLLLLVTAHLCGGFVYSICNNYYRVSYSAETDLQETSDSLGGPYQGWYHIYAYTLTDTGAPDESLLAKQKSESAGNALALIQINLKYYAAGDISQAALDQLDAVFSSWGKSGSRLIVRFLYDWDGNAAASEPKSVDIVKRHMQQTAQVVNRHADLIYTLQGIFVGNYGEMHGSEYLDSQTMRSLAKYLAKLIHPSIYLAVRTPQHWRSIVKSMSPLDKEKAHDGSLGSRLGLFNDGMTGSESDLGTYGTDSLKETGDDYSAKGTREDELEFQNKLCLRVPNGGEVVTDNVCNDGENAISDLARMHVSYLNMDYDSAVLNKWKNTVYHGDDCYDGLSVYDYIGRHLGFRYVPTASGCTFNTWRDRYATLKINIKNTGFANAYRSFSVQIRLVSQDTGEKTDLDVKTDNRLWDAGKKTKLEIPLDIRSYGKGTYKVYLSVTDPVAGQDILLATNLARTEDGYLVGELGISK